MGVQQDRQVQPHEAHSSERTTAAAERGSMPPAAHPPLLHALLGATGNRAARRHAAAGLQRAAGNHAAGRLIQAKRRAGPTGDRFEIEADRIADAVLRARAQDSAETPPAQPAAPGAAGAPLPDALRSFFETRFGRDLTGVRLHTDSTASGSATALDALAFTEGEHVTFAAGRYAPHTPAGLHLLAHELTHVIQQRALPAATDRAPAISHAATGHVQRQPPPDAGAVATPTPGTAGYTLPADLQNVPVPDSVSVQVDVAVPSLRNPNRASVAKEQMLFHYPITSSSAILLYAVPADKVFPTEAEARAAGHPPRRDDEDEHPTRFPAFPPAGATAYTTEFQQIDVVAATAEHVVTSTYTKLAVGAGSTTVVQTPAGIILIDAGVHQVGGRADAAIAQATMQKLRDIIGRNPIREILITHVHYDHTALLDQISRTFEVQSLRVNAIQEFSPDFQALRATIAAGQQAYRQQVEAGIRADLAAQRATWEGAQPVEPDAGVRQARWDTHVQDQVNTRLAQIQTTRVDILIPHQGQLHVVSTPVAQGGIPAGTATDTPSATPGSTARPTTGGTDERGRSAVTDPEFAQRLAEARRTGTPEREVDRFSTSWVINLPGGTQLLALPDLRAQDFATVRRNFIQALNRLGYRDVSFRVWDISHHMQAGFTQKRVRAQELVQITRFLNDFLRPAARTGGVTSDLVVVSVHGDPTNPTARSYVDPANVWLLRSLGMEVFLATTGRDIEVIDVLTAGGRRVSGVSGREYEGARPSDLLVRRAHAAVESLATQNRLLRRAQRGLARISPDFAANQTTLTTNEARIQGIRAALEGYVRQVEAEIGRGPQSPRPAVAPAAGGAEPAPAEAAALRTQLQGFDQPVVGESPRFTEAALVIIRRETAATLNPATRQILEARDQIATLREQLRTTETPHELQLRLIERMNALRGLLEVELPNTTGPSRPLIEDEIARLRQEVQRLTVPEGARASVRRVPGTGELVETRVVAVRKVAPESAALRRTRAAAAGLGRALGGVMVYQTISAQGELQRRFEAGQATTLEYAAGTTHNALGVVIGVRLVRGLHVPGVGFVILAALDIAQAAARSYDTEAQRNTEVAYAVIRNGVNLALMAVGGALMRVPHPAAIIAGLAIMFVGDPILEALGIHDLLEQAFEFNPAEVTEVSQRLRPLLAQYRVMVGALELAERDAQGFAALGAQQPEQVRADARRAASAARMRALTHERPVLSAFEEAYARARTSYAGLQELDYLRREFLTLQARTAQFDPEVDALRARQEERRRQMQRAQEEWNRHPTGQGVPPSTAVSLQELGEPPPIRSRALAEETFARIERNLSLDQQSADQIRALEQWSRMELKFNGLHSQLFDQPTDRINWRWVNDEMRELTTIFANARYRLEPIAQGGYRSAPLLSPGTEARRVYEEELSRRETRFFRLRQRLTEALSGVPPTLPPGMAAYEADRARRDAEWNRHPTGQGVPPSMFMPPPPPHTEHENVPPTLTADTVLEQVQRTLELYRRLTTAQPARPADLSAVELYRNSTVSGTRYRAWVEDTPAYAQGLARLEGMESALFGLLEQARRIVGQPGDTATPQQERFTTLSLDALAAVAERKDRQGILYLREATALAVQTRQDETRALATKLGQGPEVRPLSPAELTALQSPDLEGSGRGLSTISNRLAQLPEIQLADASGYLKGVYRLVGQLTLADYGGRSYTEADNVVVGDAGEGQRLYLDDNYSVDTRRIVPLNRAATEAFAGQAVRLVQPERLQRIRLADLRP